MTTAAPRVPSCPPLAVAKEGRTGEGTPPGALPAVFLGVVVLPHLPCSPLPNRRVAGGCAVSAGFKVDDLLSGSPDSSASLREGPTVLHPLPLLPHGGLLSPRAWVSHSAANSPGRARVPLSWQSPPPNGRRRDSCGKLQTHRAFSSTVE